MIRSERMAYKSASILTVSDTFSRLDIPCYFWRYEPGIQCPVDILEFVWHPSSDSFVTQRNIACRAVCLSIHFFVFL